MLIIPNPLNIKSLKDITAALIIYPMIILKKNDHIKNINLMLLLLMKLFNCNMYINLIYNLS